MVSLTDLRVNPGKTVKQVAEMHCPMLLTSRGHGVAVVQSAGEFGVAEEEWDFMRDVVVGLNDLDSGREVSLKEAKARLGF